MNFRNTPNLDEDFITEAKAVGVIEVTKECFERTLLAQCVEEGNTSNEDGCLDVLEVLEDYNHAYVQDGKFHLAVSYIARHALI